jgi:DNA-binding NtrC family response regulator
MNEAALTDNGSTMRYLVMADLPADEGTMILHTDSIGSIESEVSTRHSDDFNMPDIGLSILVGERIRAGTIDLYAEALLRMERQLFSEVLRATDGNQSKAASLLGITRGKVRDRMLHFNIQVMNFVRIAKSK